MYRYAIDETDQNVAWEFERDPRASRVRLFCTWAAGLDKGNAEIVPQLTAVLNNAARTLPDFMLSNFNVYTTDGFGRSVHDTDMRGDSADNEIRGDPAERRLALILRAAPLTSLVELLKLPYAIGPLRSITLHAIEDRAGIEFRDNLWSFVDWAESPAGRRWNLDLTSRPTKTGDVLW